MAQTIVVVDDEPDLCELMKDLLKAAGYQVIAVPHPGEVEARIGDAQPDLFLIDIMLPGISGIELAQDLRTTEYRDVPMIAMSASKMMTTVASQSGVFTDALNKPFDLDQLLACIDHHLRETAAS